MRERTHTCKHRKRVQAPTSSLIYWTCKRKYIYKTTNSIVAEPKTGRLLEAVLLGRHRQTSLARKRITNAWKLNSNAN